MKIPVQRWLEPFSWSAVTDNNAAICKAKSALHKPTSDGHEPARRLWENACAREISLIEALDICRECHRLAPFCFYNGNTFAGIARAMVYPLLQRLDAPTALIVRNTVGHYVAGTIGRTEMEQVVKALEAK
ncbi:MAG: hypothetical protein HOP33_07775 [Verrucomicrobia bacterium]|nr:hypothetical protein [Verrucomicrobiota bacterium]